VRSLLERTTTWAGSSCEWGGCVGKRDAPYIFLIHITPRPGGVGAPLKIPLKKGGKKAKPSGGCHARVSEGRPDNPLALRAAPGNFDCAAALGEKSFETFAGTAHPLFASLAVPLCQRRGFHPRSRRASQQLYQRISAPLRLAASVATASI